MSVLLFQVKNKSHSNPEAGYPETHLFHCNPQDGHRLFSKSKHRRQHTKSFCFSKALPLALRGSKVGIPEEAGQRAPIMLSSTLINRCKRPMYSGACTYLQSCTKSQETLSGPYLLLAGRAQARQVTGRHGEPGWLLHSHGSS